MIWIGEDKFSFFIIPFMMIFIFSPTENQNSSTDHINQFHKSDASPEKLIHFRIRRLKLTLLK